MKDLFKKTCYYILISIIILYIYNSEELQKYSIFFEILFWGSIFLSASYVFYRKILDKKISKIDYIIMFFWLYILVASCNEFNWVSFKYSIYQYIVYLIPFYSIQIIEYLKEDLKMYDLKKFSLLFYRFNVTLISFLSLYEYSARRLITSGNAHHIIVNNEVMVRSQVFSGSPLMLGMLLALSSIIFYSRFLYSRQKMDLLTFVLSCTGMLVTGSRGPMVAAFVGIICASVLMIKINVRLLLKIGGIVSIIILIALLSLYMTREYFSTSPIILKILSIFDWSNDPGNSIRLEKWNQFYRMFQSRRVFGYGPSTTGSITLGREFNLGVTESSILKLLVELGVVGFILYITIIISTLKDSFMKIKHHHMKNKIIIATLICIIVAILTEGIVLQIIEMFNISVLLWSSIGILYLVNSNEREDII